MEIENASSNFTTPEWDYNWPLITTNILQGIGTVIGVPANAFLLFLFAVTPSLRTLPNILLLQRAIADLISMFPFPFIIYFRVVGFSGISQILCRTLSLILHITMVASLILLMSYTLYNYQASNPNYFTRQYRMKTVRFTSIIAWVLGLAVGLAALFLPGYCDFAPLFNHESIAHVLGQMSVILIIPLVMVWVFVSMTSSIRPVASEDESLGGGEEEVINRQLLLGLAILYTVVYGAYWLLTLIQQIFTPHILLGIIASVVSGLGIYTEVLNPIIVMYLSRDVRQVVFAWLMPSGHRPNTIPMH